MKRQHWMRFFEADGVGGGGGEVTTDAPTPEAALAAITEFEAPEPNLIDDLTKPKEDAKPEPKKEDTKPESKKDEPKPKTQTDPPAKQLRDELANVKKERDELRAKVDKPSPKQQELETSVADLTRERDALKAEREAFEKKLSAHDPLSNSRVKELQSKFDSEYTAGIEMVPELEANYRELVSDFAKLPRGDRAQYAAALQEFEQKLEDAVGARKFGTAMDLIRKGHGFINDQQKLVKEVKSDAGRFAFEERENQWKGADKEISTLLEGAITPPEGLEETDPYNPLLFVNKSLGEMEEPKRKELVSKVDNYVRKLFAGPKPRSDKEFAGLGPEEIQEKIKKEQEWHANARQQGIKGMKLALLTMAQLRPFLTEFSKLNALAEKRSLASPPDPTNPGSIKTADDGDIANFKMPSLADF